MQLDYRYVLRNALADRYHSRVLLLFLVIFIYNCYQFHHVVFLDDPVLTLLLLLLLLLTTATVSTTTTTTVITYASIAAGVGRASDASVCLSVCPRSKRKTA